MKQILIIVTFALLFISCSDDNSESDTTLLGKWYFVSATIGGVTQPEEQDDCDRDYLEFTTNLLQETVFTKIDDPECAVTSSITSYNKIGSTIHDSSLTAPLYEIISLTQNELVLRSLQPESTSEDDIIYTLSRT